MNHPIRVLLVEDEDDHAVLLRRVAERASVNVIGWATTLAQTREALARQPLMDAVLLDLNLPDSRGLDTLDVVMSTRLGVPVVVLSSLSDAELALDALNAGAEDYLGKSELSAPALERTLRYAIERHRLVRHIEEQADAMDAFALAVSGDLRGPLAQINTIAAWLREDYGPMFGEVGQQHLAMLDEAADQIRHLAHDLELYTQAAAGGLQIVPVDLRDIVEDAFEGLGEALYVRDDRLQIGPLPDALVDREQMTRALQVLLALALADRDSCLGRLRIRGRSGGSWCTVVIEHSGRAFAKGNRDDGPWVATRGATLSLALAGRIVEAHGGVLTTRSEPDGGSTVVLTLPRVPEEVRRSITSIEQ